MLNEIQQNFKISCFYFDTVFLAISDSQYESDGKRQKVT
jgi:hypothetical protein